jgi:hypothetical protein
MSDERGRFEFTDAPSIEGALLLASHEGFGSLAQPAPDVSDRALELVLRRPVVGAGMLAGEVVDERGRPAAARARLAGPLRAGAERRARRVRAEAARGRRARRMDRGQGSHQPAIEAASAAVKSGHPAPDEFVVLELGPPPLSISGRVLDDAGRPQAGLKVFVSDPTFFGAFDEVPIHVEGVLAGAATRADLEQAMAKAPAGQRARGLAAEHFERFWTFARTDADGAFELKGLLDRNYRLAALDPGSLLRVDSEPIPAGTQDAVLRLPADAYLHDVRGQVLTKAGAPVAGVEVSPHLEVLTVHIDEHSWSSFDVDSKSVLTDADGRFAFERLPRERVYLAFSGEDILPLEWARREQGGIAAVAGKALDHIVVRVALRYHFQVEVAPDVADQLRVLDAQGKTVMINVFEGSSKMSTDAMALTDGRSKVMVVGEDARTLVLSKAGEEVSRVPLKLVQGEMNLVRL